MTQVSTRYQQIVVKVLPEVRHEVVVIAAVGDPEQGRVRDEEVVGDHHHHDMPPSGPRHLVLGQPGLGGHIEIVSSPASSTLHILHLQRLVQQGPAVAVVLLLHVALQAVVTLTVNQ